MLEIKRTLADQKREKEIGGGVPMPIFEGRLKNANRPLLEELEELRLEREFIRGNQQLFINTLSIATALLIAFFARP